MPIVGQIPKTPETEPRTVYSPPGSENPSDREGRKSGPVVIACEVSETPAYEPGVSVYYDSETDVELLLAVDGQSLTIRIGNDRLELSGREWRGLYSGMMNLGPGRSVNES